MIASVRHFISRRAQLQSLACEEYREYLSAWPLPLGKEPLREWFFERRLLLNTDELAGLDMDDRNDDRGWLLRMLDFKRPERLEGVPDWLTPLLAEGRDWCALAVERRLDFGGVWLLGLVRELTFEASHELNPIARHVAQTDTKDQRFSQRLECVDPKAYPNPLTENAHKILLEEKVYAKTELGLRHTLEVVYFWEWVAPVVLIEASPTKPGELAALAAEADKLTKWYNATLLGKEFKTRGGGPPPLFTTQDQCRTAVVNAYRALLRSNPRPTRPLVAQRLYLSETGLKKALARFGLKWKDLVAEARAK